MQIISRQSARDLGLKRYFTNEPCKNGHTAERYVSEGTCAKCQSDKWARWARANPERYAVLRKRSYVKNRVEWNRRSQERHKANPEVRRAQSRQQNEKLKARRVEARAAANAVRVAAGLPFMHRRKEAVALGEAFYYTGKPCLRGHIEVPRASNTGSCVECNRERARENYAKDPGVSRAWQRANPDKVAGYVRKWQAKNAEAMSEKARARYQKKRRAAGYEPKERRRKQKDA